MATKVVPVGITATTTTARARASVVVVVPVSDVSTTLLAAATYAAVIDATVTLVVPVSRLSHITMAAGARLDTTGLFTYVADVVSVADAVSKNSGKTLADVFPGFTDYTTRAVVLGKNDSVSVPDYIIRTLEYLRRFYDTIVPTDAAARAFTKGRTDTIVPIDAAALAFTKGRTDTIVPIDAAALAFTKGRTDAVGTTDTAVRGAVLGKTDIVVGTDYTTRSVAKSRADSVVPVDVLQRAFSRPRFDTVGATDAPQKALTRPATDVFGVVDSFFRTWIATRQLSDGVAMNDSAGVGDGIQYQAAKYIANVVFPTDSNTRQPQLKKTDTLSTVDTGYLTSQSYGDVSYFAESYAGTDRTF